MNLNYEQGLRMAEQMKDLNEQIIEKIQQTQQDQHGVVFLEFDKDANFKQIGIMDAPYEPNVRFYIGEQEEDDDEPAE